MFLELDSQSQCHASASSGFFEAGFLRKECHFFTVFTLTQLAASGSGSQPVVVLTWKAQAYASIKYDAVTVFVVLTFINK